MTRAVICARMFFVILSFACQVSAAPVRKSPMQTVQENGLMLFQQLSRTALARDALLNTDVQVTILAPTDQAFKRFLQEMGITWTYLQENEALADAILGYHLLPGFPAASADFTAKFMQKITPLKAMTAAEPYSVTFRPASPQGTAQQWLAEDMQGNVARVAAADLGAGAHRVLVIDRVLYSGAYWPNFDKLFATLPSLFSAFQTAIQRSGPAAAALTAEGATNTLFLPTDAAFKQGGVSLDAPAAKIAALLKAHALAGVGLSIPGGFKQGSQVATLGGQVLTVMYKQEGSVHKSSGLHNYVAYMASSSGQTARVISPNLFVSKAQVHVINRVLKPLQRAATATAAATADAPPPLGPATTPTTITMTSAEGVKAPAAAAAATRAAADVNSKQPSAASSAADVSTVAVHRPTFGTALALPRSKQFGHHRKLLATGNGEELATRKKNASERAAIDYVQSIELSAAEQAILMAVNSHADASAVEDVGHSAMADTVMASRFPVHANYAAGFAEASVQLLDNDPGQND